MDRKTELARIIRVGLKEVLIVSAEDKQVLYEWACSNYSTELREKWLKSMDEQFSYFERKEKHKYLQEYTYETLPQMQDALSELWQNDEVMTGVQRQIAVFAIKNKKKGLQKYESANGQGEQLVDYIYNF